MTYANKIAVVHAVRDAVDEHVAHAILAAIEVAEQHWNEQLTVAHGTRVRDVLMAAHNNTIST